jgi:hypothetical protein
MPQCFQLRPEARERCMIGAKTFEVGGRNLLRAQPAIFIAQAREFLGVSFRALQRDAQTHRLSPFHGEHCAASEHDCGKP